MKIKANNANSHIWKEVYSHSKLPQQLEPLNEIATNLWWVWNHEGAKLFGKIDKQLWKSTEGNPVQLLQSPSHKRMEEILADKASGSIYLTLPKGLMRIISRSPLTFCLIRMILNNVFYAMIF